MEKTNEDFSNEALFLNRESSSNRKNIEPNLEYDFGDDIECENDTISGTSLFFRMTCFILKCVFYGFC